MIKIHNFVNSVLNSKTYVLYCDESRNAWVADIGDVEPVLHFLEDNKLSVVGVFLTHGHYDHFYGLQALIDYFPACKVYATEYTKQAIASEELNLSFKSDKPITYHGNNVFVVKEGDEFALFNGDPLLHIYEVPGHNPGCIAMVIGDYIFTGDAYIPGLGVKDFVPFANKEQAKRSMERILKMSEGKTIFAGHQV